MLEMLYRRENRGERIRLCRDTRRGLNMKSQKGRKMLVVRTRKTCPIITNTSTSGIFNNPRISAETFVQKETILGIAWSTSNPSFSNSI